VAPEQQMACSSEVTRAAIPRGNEVLCYKLDGSLQVLVVAPVMTNLDAAGGGDDYYKAPKGNLDVTGEFFIWTSNMGTARMDAFIVRVPKQRLGGGSAAPPPPPAQPPAAPPGGGAYTLTITRPTGGTILGPEIFCGDDGAAACAVTKPAGTAIELLALPSAGNSLASWGGCAASFVLSANMSCAPSFSGPSQPPAQPPPTGPPPPSFPPPPPPTGADGPFILTVSRVPGGTILGPSLFCGDMGDACQMSFAKGTYVELAVLVTEGNSFTGWVACSNAFTVNSDLTCTPSYNGNIGPPPAPPPPSGTFVLSVVNPGAGGGGGFILGPEMVCEPGNVGTCSLSYSTPRVVTLTPVPYAGFTFSGWSGAGCASTMTISGPTTCTATFTRN
jgi:hypothetical protein